jgi:hypothetical protein
LYIEKSRFKPPKNWPGSFIYSPESVGKEIHIAVLRLALFSTSPEDQKKITPCIEEKRVHPHLEIRKITSQLCYRGPRPHPLSNRLIEGRDQLGLFAKKKIPKEADLGEFVGEIHLLDSSSALDEKGNGYNWVINWKNQFFVCIDPRKTANELAFANDYRGLQNAPNVYSKWMINRGFYFFGFAASRDIERDEEIVIDYGSEWDRIYRQKLANRF